MSLLASTPTTVTRAEPTWSNAGALTTLFTPPASCPGFLVYSDGGPLTGTLISRDWRMYECYPNREQLLQHTYHSPAVCPSGWYSAYDYLPNYRGLPAPASDESIALCCPSGFSAQVSGIEFTHKCVSQLKTAVSLSECRYQTCPPDTDIPTTDSSGNPITAFEVPLVIRWRSSDLPALALATAASGDTNTAAQGTQEGLSTGAKIGIGVGVPLAIILLVVAFFLGRKWRSSPQRGSPIELPDEPVFKNEAVPQHGKSELPSGRMSELPSDRTTSELPVEGFAGYYKKIPSEQPPVELSPWTVAESKNNGHKPAELA